MQKHNSFWEFSIEQVKAYRSITRKLQSGIGKRWSKVLRMLKLNLVECIRLVKVCRKTTRRQRSCSEKAAEQDNVDAQGFLGYCYWIGQGVPEDFVEAYRWLNLASAQGNERAKVSLPRVKQQMTAEQIAEAQQLAREFKPNKPPTPGTSISREGIFDSRPTAAGTGFFITEDGYLIANEHVVKDTAQVRLVTSAGLISAKVVKVDAANDLALLKAEGKFSALPIAASRGLRLGATVATVGFPNIGLQGFSPKVLAHGHQAAAALAASGALAENVNYAVKSSYLLKLTGVGAGSVGQTQRREREGDEV